MPIIPDNNLNIYVLNVGQADTSIIITPEGRIIIIDAVRPTKIINLLGQLGHGAGDPIEKLIITHPHRDHFSGANRLNRYFSIRSLTVSPFWNELGMGPPTYREMLNSAEQGVDVDFISGYSRYYPDGALGAQGSHFVFNRDAFYMEFLGPPNSLINQLEIDNKLDTNHLSLISRIKWRDFSMILAGDAQMENWSFFDREGMLGESCNILKSAHHGSCNGTQWERLDRLDPRFIIVSCNPDDRRHGLPDLVGTSIFHKYSVDHPQRKVILTTVATGSLKFVIEDGRLRQQFAYADDTDSDINFNNKYSLTWNSNRTNWSELLDMRIRELYEE